jgi:mannose-6-phosphate isomerase class I
MNWRNTVQYLLPLQRPSAPAGAYDIYPAYPIASGQIRAGYDALAAEIAGHRLIILDGGSGVLWGEVRAHLDQSLRVLLGDHRRICWIDAASMLRPEPEIEALVAPFLGGDDPLFGTRFTGTLSDFFQPGIASIVPADDALTIIYGCGAGLFVDGGFLVYLDVPKAEVQFRARAGSITNLGRTQPDAHKAMYKRFYFVDWIALNRHKATLLPKIDLFVDVQRPETPTFISGEALRDTLSRMSATCFRVRPWFEPGVWGGQWIKQRIPQLPQNVPNYAWSFELITPENGLLIESDGLIVEVSFECLMMHAAPAVLGECAARFGIDFPIRFDFLDTVAGDNLSIQCHPRPDYIRAHFGEPFTQDETYYILDCEPGAKVYLGFAEGADRETFREALEDSQRTGTPIAVDQFVYVEDLIPNGTIHGAGRDNLVLEISATPYIFTFKIYDWLRLDLDGKPRPLNLDRAFDNLDFTRRGATLVQRELVAHPAVIASASDWQIVHLPTHPEQFFDVHRLEFATAIEVDTDGSAHILSLVEGECIRVEIAGGYSAQFSYAETFVIPAAAGRYRLINLGTGRAKVVKAFVKPGI